MPRLVQMQLWPLSPSCPREAELWGEALRAAFGAEIELSPFECKVRAQELRTNILDRIESLFRPGWQGLTFWWVFCVRAQE